MFKGSVRQASHNQAAQTWQIGYLYLRTSRKAEGGNYMENQDTSMLAEKGGQEKTWDLGQKSKFFKHLWES